MESFDNSRQDRTMSKILVVTSHQRKVAILCLLSFLALC